MSVALQSQAFVALNSTSINHALMSESNGKLWPLPILRRTQLQLLLTLCFLLEQQQLQVLLQA